MDLEGNIGNLMTALSGVIGVTAAFFTLKGHVNNNEDKIQDLKDKMTKDNEVLHLRIEKTQETASKYIEKTDSEFKEINANMNNVLIETSAIKGMIEILLNK